MVDEQTLQQFTKQLESFKTAFESIAQSLQTQLNSVLEKVTKLAENTSFMPKVMKSNKEIKKMGEQLELIMDGLLARLDSISEEKGYM